MASIVTRRSSYAVVYMTTMQGQRKQKWETYHTREEAERRKKLLELHLESRQSTAFHQVAMVCDLMERYVLLYGSVKWSLSTFQSNQGLIRNYIIPLFGAIRLEELSPRMVAELYLDFLEQPRCSNRYHKAGGKTVTGATLQSVHKLLHSTFENAVLWDLVDRNPFHRAALPSITHNLQRFLSPNQIMQLLLNCQDTQLQLALHLAFAGTLRKGEILALTWDNLCWEHRKMQIEKTLERVSREALDRLHGKDVLFEFSPVLSAEKTALILKTPKTQSSRRSVYLPETVMNLLTLAYRQRTPIQNGAPNLIFRYPDGRPIQEHWLNQRLRNLTNQLALPPITFHSLRHSSISYKLVLTSGNIKAVQRDAGHAQAAMVTEVYGHIWDENRRDNAQQFETQFYGGGGTGK